MHNEIKPDVEVKIEFNNNRRAYTKSDYFTQFVIKENEQNGRKIHFHDPEWLEKNNSTM